MKRSVQFIRKISTRIPYFREAAVVRVFGGMNRFRLQPQARNKDGRELLFDDTLLAYGSATGCPTCETFLRHGYGEGIVGAEACREVGDRLNGPYGGLREAVGNLAPILGLMESGCYVLADAFQFPSVPWRTVSAGETDYTYEDFIAGASVGSTSAFDAGIRFLGGFPDPEYHTVPLFLWASQRPQQMDWSRVRHYMERFAEDDDTLPRPVALYLNGAVSLVLDGHHKVAAAAMLGRPVRTILIFRVEKAKPVLSTLGASGRLWFCSAGSSAFFADARIGENRERTGTVLSYGMSGVPPFLCDREGARISDVACWSGSRPPADGRRPPVQYERCDTWNSRTDCEFLKNYKPRHDLLPSFETLVRGTRIDLARIRETVDVLRRARALRKEYPANAKYFDWTAVRDLIAYKELFPRSKWIADSELNRLIDWK